MKIVSAGRAVEQSELACCCFNCLGELLGDIYLKWKVHMIHCPKYIYSTKNLTMHTKGCTSVSKIALIPEDRNENESKSVALLGSRMDKHIRCIRTMDGTQKGE